MCRAHCERSEAISAPHSECGAEFASSRTDLGFTRDRHLMCANRASPTCVRSSQCPGLGLFLPVAALVELVLLALDGRHRIGAGEPAVQVDVGAASRAER